MANAAPLVGCAVVGLVVAGPVGAVVGGVLGAVVGNNVGRKQVMDSLGVTGIRLPREGVMVINGTTFFTVEVSHATRGTTKVLRRYSEFYNLQRRARVRYPFPPKLWSDCSGHRLEQRRAGLEAWLSYVSLRFSHYGVPNALQNEMNSFLFHNAQTVQPAHFVQPDAAAGYVAPAAAAPMAPPASQHPAPVPPVPQVPPVPPVQQQVLLSISVPDGVVAGQAVAVKLPDGRELTITVPPGAAKEIQVVYDPSSAQLSLAGQQPAPAPQDPAGTPEIFAIQVPMGIVPGQELQVVVPDGRQLNITLPHGKQPGDELRVRVDAGRLVLA
ncbi:unnamed protein product [Effrenium voratum]|nr:unnamed protein product [Effrenium voratum]